MNNEYYGVSTTSSQDFLAHYGVKGMKWGVRKAIASGSDRALRRQYKKAAKKLAKLEKLGANGKKYAKRAAAYGAGAVAAGGLAAAGTGGVSRLLRGAGSVGAQGMRVTGSAMNKLGVAAGKVATAPGNMSNRKRAIFGNAAQILTSGGKAVSGAAGSVSKAGRNAGTAVSKWGASKSIGNAVGVNVQGASNVINQGSSKLKGVSNNTIARIGAGAVGAGLGIAAGRNAYRAATAKKHAAQAQEFRREMNKAFAGTKYANGMPKKSKKRRK